MYQQTQQPQMYGQSYSINRPIYQSVGTTTTSPYQGIKGRPVSSLEEARASIIDFDGSVFFFPDLANRRIYTKQINLDGTAIMNMYELKELPQIEPSINQSNFVTRQEFEEAMTALRAAVTQPVQAQPQAQTSEPKREEKPVSAVSLNF